MNLNQGKRNKQAVQVLNKVEYDADGNPIGMMEDPSNPASANFGTPREPRRGGCYLGNGSAYITITGLLSTDTIEVMEGSDLPTISNDRLDIASGDKVFGVKIFRAGELWGKYNCSENSGNICYDSSGNGHHGTIINAITTTPEENPNSIHQYQDVYSFENEEGFSKLGAYFNLQHLGVYSPTPILISGETYTLPTPTLQNWNAINLGSSIPYFISGDTWKFTARVRNANGAPSSQFYFDSTIFYDTSGIRGGNVPTNGDWVTFQYIGKVSVSNFQYVARIYAGVTQVIYEVQIDFESYASGNVVEKTLVPKNSSITLPPFKDVLGNNLQYVGKVPGKAKFVGSSCFKGDGVAYLAITGLLTTDTIEVFGSSGVPTIPTNGELHVAAGDEVYGVKILRDGVLWSYLPLCEPIIDPSNHVYHDVSGNGNHATLINGTLANEGKQDGFHYLQRGLKNDGVNQIVPILDDESGFADGSLLTDENAIQQDSHSFLNTGTELQAYDYPALRQADKNEDVWYDESEPQRKSFDSLTYGVHNNQYFVDNSDESNTRLTNITTYHKPLVSRQIPTEEIVRNVRRLVGGIGDWIIGTTFEVQ